jgi:hypothetical protein
MSNAKIQMPKEKSSSRKHERTKTRNKKRIFKKEGIAMELTAARQRTVVSLAQLGWDLKGTGIKIRLRLNCLKPELEMQTEMN